MESGVSRVVEVAWVQWLVQVTGVDVGVSASVKFSG